MKKIRLLVNIIYSDGCNLHRLILPHGKLEKLTDDFEVQWGFPKDIVTEEAKIKYISTFDIFIFHRVFDCSIEKLKKACPNTIIIVDVDDYWVLGQQHPAYNIYQSANMTEKVKEAIIHSDYVTTTTTILADKVKEYNTNVKILPNALSDVIPHPVESDRVRFGIIGGVSHLPDVELLRGVVNGLPKDVLDKSQFVLCGFDKGIIRHVYEDGTVENIQMPWEDTAWVKMERILTNDYRLVSKEHKQFLERFLQSDSDSGESYRRIWARDIWNYLSCYDEIDVLLVPLLDNEFNKYKSELKMIEASVMQKPVIVSDVFPYKICGINAVEYGGNINPEGNCIMVNNQKGCKGWIKAIQRLVKDTELRSMITENIMKLTDNTYDLNNVTQERIDFYKQILQ